MALCCVINERKHRLVFLVIGVPVLTGSVRHTGNPPVCICFVPFHNRRCTHNVCSCYERGACMYLKLTLEACLFVGMWICFWINSRFRIGLSSLEPLLHVCLESRYKKSPFSFFFNCVFLSVQQHGWYFPMCFNFLKGVRAKHAEAKAGIKC